MGGSALTWDSVLPLDIVPNSSLELNLVMTKHEPPDVRIGYTVELQRRPTNVESNQLPSSYNLHQNYPNPFNPRTTIRYSLPEKKLVRIKIYDILGREVRVLVNETKSAGEHQAIWDGRDNIGKVIASGVYFYRIETDAFRKTSKMLFIQ